MCIGVIINLYPLAPEKQRVDGCKPDNPSCQRTRQTGSLYCLGHDPDAKDYKQFMDGLTAELDDPARDLVNAEGWVFPADEDGFVKLDSKAFSKPLILKKAEFKGNVYFNLSEFPPQTDFTEAHFFGDADFTGAQFKEDKSGTSSITFDGARFEQEVKFENTTFSENASFVGCRFNAEIKMNGQTNFLGEALFNRTQFEGETTFSRATFTGKADFTDAFFHSSAKFVGTKFFEQALFERTNFAELVDFKNAEFHISTATFVSAIFQQRVVFDETQFFPGGNVSFNKAKFNGSASFENSKFGRVSYFTETEFAQKVEFSKHTSFTQPAHFRKTVFNEVSFDEVEFNQKAEFSGTRFNGWAEFSQVKFSGETIFDRAQFSHLTVFNDAIFGENVSFNVHVNERNRLAIRNSDLSRVRFSGSNIENIEFQDCKWFETRFYRWKIAGEPRPANLTDEQLIKLREARRLYRQLRLNYDKVGAYEIAGRFYVSESEMSYLMLRPIYRWIHPRGLYKWASRYGESIVQAAVGMVVLVLLFTVFYYIYSAQRQIWFKEPPKIFGTQNMVTLSWWESVWLSVQASKPLADLGLSPKTIPYWIVLIEGLMVPTQIGLFLLAIRRRFRRGD